MKSRVCSEAFLTLIIFITALSYSVFFVTSEDKVYFWDARGYWQEFAYSTGIFLTSRMEYVKYIINSIRASDYNASPVALFIPSGIILGTTRIVYISSIVVLYLIPVCFIFSKLINTIALKAEINKNNFAVWFLIAASFPSLWFPTLRGAPDIIGLFSLTVAIWIIVAVPTDRFRFWPFVMLGVLFWLPFLFRRWYVYSIISICLTSPILSIYMTVKIAPLKKVLLCTISNYAISAVVMVILIASFQTELVLSILTSQYSNEFASYQVTLHSHIISFINYFGIINLIVLSIALIACFFVRSIAPFILYGFANLALTFFLFTRMQAFDVHHYLPVAFWCLFITCLTISAATSRIEKRGVQQATLIVLTALFLIVSVVSSLCSWNGGKPFLGAVPLSAAPYRISNADNYHRLADKLLELTENGEQVSVFASSAKLNDSMLLSLSDERLAGRLAPVTQIDLRTGIEPISILSRYAVVTNPVQTHLPTGQEIVKLTNELIRSGMGIGSAYRKVSADYRLDGMSADVYERTRAFSNEEANDYIDRIYHFYPDWQERYNRPILLSAMTSSISLGDIWGRSEFNKIDDSFFLHPGATKPTTLQLAFKGMLTFRLAGPCEGMNGVTLTVGDKSSSSSKTLHSSSDIQEFNTTALAPSSMFISVGNNGDPRCDGVIMKLQPQ